MSDNALCHPSCPCEDSPFSKSLYRSLVALLVYLKEKFLGGNFVQKPTKLFSSYSTGEYGSLSLFCFECDGNFFTTILLVITLLIILLPFLRTSIFFLQMCFTSFHSAIHTAGHLSFLLCLKAAICHQQPSHVYWTSLAHHFVSLNVLPDVFKVAKHRKVGPLGSLFISPARVRSMVETGCLGPWAISILALLFNFSSFQLN